MTFDPHRKIFRCVLRVAASGRLRLCLVVEQVFIFPDKQKLFKLLDRGSLTTNVFGLDMELSLGDWAPNYRD